MREIPYLQARVKLDTAPVFREFCFAVQIRNKGDPMYLQSNVFSTYNTFHFMNESQVYDRRQRRYHHRLNVANIKICETCKKSAHTNTAEYARRVHMSTAYCSVREVVQWPQYICTFLWRHTRRLIKTRYVVRITAQKGAAQICKYIHKYGTCHDCDVERNIIHLTIRTQLFFAKLWAPDTYRLIFCTKMHSGECV